MKKVMIVGCGNMGALYDFGADPSLPPRSHLSAFRSDPRFTVTTLVDPRREVLDKLGQATGISELHTSLEQVADLSSYDVVTLATSSHVRLDVLRQVCGKAKLIFCEKPLARNLNEARQIAAVLREQPSKFALNYSRRWAQGISDTMKRAAQGEWGAVCSINVVYTKGVVNNASHVYDLLGMLGLKPLRVRRTGDLIADGYDEPTFSFDIQYSTSGSEQSSPCVDAHFTALNFKNYTVWEIEIWLERGRIRLSKSGSQIEIFKVVSDEVYRDYRVLAPQENLSGGIEYCMKNAVNEVFDLLQDHQQGQQHDQRQPSCGIANGLEVAKLSHALLLSVSSANQWIDLETSCD